MKRFWLVMLSLGLVLAFSASAMAVDVKFSGEFYAAGMYLDKTKLEKDTDADGPSTAFYYQRLRVQSDFIVSPGLKLVTRFDAMERIWGGYRFTEAAPPALATDSAGFRSENENIAIDWAYIDYASPIGTFNVGYMNYGATGTVFGNSSKPVGRIKYSYAIGPATINAAYSKVMDNSFSAVTPLTATDADQDVYQVEGVYTWKDGKVGLAVNYYRYADKRPGSGPTKNYTKNYYQFTPYAIAKIGPVALQAELIYATGKAKEYDGFLPSGTDITLSNLAGWIDATATFAPVYFGGTFAYISGDDPNTPNKEEGGTLSGGTDWNPCLIMFNQDLAYWVGTLQGYNSTSNASGMGAKGSSTTAPGAWFGQGRVGVKPIAALDIMASLSYAQAEKKPALPAVVLNSTFGWEIDVTGTYKLTNNLSYMLGVGYWFVGDYYKGNNNANSLNNDFMLINKLTLTF